MPLAGRDSLKEQARSKGGLCSDPQQESYFAGRQGVARSGRQAPSLLPSTPSALPLGCSPTRHAATSSALQKPLLASGRSKGLSAHCLLSNKDTRGSVTGARLEALRRFSFTNLESPCSGGTERACVDITSFPLPSPLQR